jgi:cytochrome P450
VNSCPHFPFPDRAGTALPADYLKLFRNEPLIRVQLKNGREALLVTRYADVKKVFTDKRYSRQAWSGGNLFARESVSLLTSDPPLHTTRRRAVQSAFTPHKAESDRPRIQGIADAQLNLMAAGPSPVDVVKAYTLPFAYTVICQMLGLPADDIAQLRTWVETITSAGRLSPEAVAIANSEAHSYIRDQLKFKQQRMEVNEPSSDLLTALLSAPEEERLSFEELVVMGFGLLTGGGDTITNHLTLCIYEILRSPGLADELRRDFTKIPDAVEELLRWVWFAGTGGVPHVVLADVELGDRVVKAGEIIIPLTDSANRDPEAFPDADLFQPGRTANHHMGLGHGRHMCLGASYARVELQVGLETLLRRFPHLELDMEEDELPWRSKMFVRGIWKLPLRWSL